MIFCKNYCREFGLNRPNSDIGPRYVRVKSKSNTYEQEKEVGDPKLNQKMIENMINTR